MPIKEIKIENIVISPEVQAYCNNPGFQCPNYGHSWCCPPNAPYMEERISIFKRFYLVYYQFEIDPHVKKIQAKHPNRSRKKIINSLYNKNLIRDRLEKEMEMILEENRDKYEETLALWDGFCRVCNNENDIGCTYDSGEPCRYPNRKRYSMEAVGINVNDTVKNVGFNLEWPPEKYLFRFGLICFK